MLHATYFSKKKKKFIAYLKFKFSCMFCIFTNSELALGEWVRVR